MKKILLLGIVLSSANLIKGQVVYTELSSPFTVNSTYAGEGFQVDFNNDATPELTIYANKVDTVLGGFLAATITGVAVYTNGATEIAGSTQMLGTETLLVADSINNIQTINNTLNYVSSSTPAFFPAVGLTADAETSTGTFITSVGKFRDVGYKYFGVRFVVNSNTHYGWVRVMCSNNSLSGTIHSFAYESQPNTPIVAGDMGNGDFLSIQNNVFDGNVYVSQNQIFSSVNVPMTIEVYSILGEKVMHTQSFGANIIDLNYLSKGIYMLNCITENGSKTLKFIKE